MTPRILFLVMASLIAGGTVVAETWDRFRGPQGSGVAQKQNLPSDFDDAKSLAWKVAIPGLGNSSPVIWNDRIFLQSASADGKERMVVCLDAKSGELLWTRASPGSKAPIHTMNSLASATPATDGKAVYFATWDGKNVTLAAVSMKGEPLWEKNLGEFKSQHGPGMSPIVYGDKVFFAHDMDGAAKLYAFDAATGNEVWSQPREAFRACYSAPQILDKGANGTELLVTSTTAITSYNPDTGSRNWNWTWSWGPNVKPLRTIAGSLVANDMLFACAGDGGGPRYMVALDLPTTAGASPKQVWDNKKDFPYVPTPLLRDGNLYFVTDKGGAGCFDAKTGKQLWLQRLADANFTASPVLVDGKIYAPSEEGDLFVLDAEPKFQSPARFRVGERVRASPAVADGRLYIRGASHLFCYGKKE